VTPEFWSFVVIQALHGLAYAMLLFLLASGLSLIFGLMDVVNLSHGSFFMLGGYLALLVLRHLESFWAAVLLVPVLVAGIGMLVEVPFLRPLYRRGHLDQVLLTFGFAFVFADVARWIWGADIHLPRPPAVLDGSVRVIGQPYPVYRLIVIAAGLAVAGGLWLFLERTRLGALLRAGVTNREMLSGLGINVGRIFSLVFGLGAGLAGLSGVIAGPILGMFIGVDFEVLILTLIVVVVGGLGTIGGAFWGSVLIGEIETFGKALFPQFAMFLIFALMALVLLVRPTGLLGLREIAVKAGGQGAFGARWALWPAERLGGVVLFALVALIPLAWPEPYVINTATEILIFAILALALDLLMGYAGLVSFGHAAFFGIGAYAAALAFLHLHRSVLVNLAVALLVTAAAAAVFGYLALRMTGIYFLMVTFALAQMGYALVYKWDAVTGGSDGLTGVGRPWLGLGPGLVDLGPPRAMFYFSLVIFVAVWGFVQVSTRAPFGRVLVGIRENELRMRALGYPVWRYKYVAFLLSGVLGGLAGALYAYYSGFVSPGLLHWTMSGEVVLMVIIGGAGTLLGPLLGAAFVLLLQNFLSSYTERWLLLMGWTFVACVLFAPKGLVGTLRDLVWLRREQSA
jgi:branched-chain amino acid transport system permease protein